MVTRSILGVFAIVVILSVVLALAKVFIWLDVLYICSYIKLSTTLIKYLPQVSARQRKSAYLTFFESFTWSFIGI